MHVQARRGGTYEADTDSQEEGGVYSRSDGDDIGLVIDCGEHGEGGGVSVWDRKANGLIGGRLHVFTHKRSLRHLQTTD